jgi:hypothetical protein
MVADGFTIPVRFRPAGLPSRPSKGRLHRIFPRPRVGTAPSGRHRAKGGFDDRSVLGCWDGYGSGKGRHNTAYREAGYDFAIDLRTVAAWARQQGARAAQPAPPIR